jgi:RIO kinase 2
MKLDASGVRFLTPDQHRLLTALEVGSKNHELVPLSLLCSISGQRPSGALNLISDLAMMRLASKESAAGGKYEGFRLCAGGYDYLALKKFSISGALSHVGNQIGVGKESDVYIAYQVPEQSVEGGEQEQAEKTLVLKIHRLGRTSFRNVKNTRDYGNNKAIAVNSWLKYSRLSAEREFTFMQALYDHGFPVPQPLAQNRHCVLMQWIDGEPLNALDKGLEPSIVASLYAQSISLLKKLASFGLVHGDFNEFNLMATCGDWSIVMIDFPQMISTGHQNAEEYFERDLHCIYRFFERRFGYIQQQEEPFTLEDVQVVKHLDALVEASGFDKKQRRIEIKRLEALKAQESFEEKQDEIQITSL